MSLIPFVFIRAKVSAEFINIRLGWDRYDTCCR